MVKTGTDLGDKGRFALVLPLRMWIVRTSTNSGMWHRPSAAHLAGAMEELQAKAQAASSWSKRVCERDGAAVEREMTVEGE
eukprot:1140434-Rhodomonas_salina.1